MGNNQLTELINKYIDSEISDNERLLLENELNTNSSAKVLLTEMLELKTKIDHDLLLKGEVSFEHEIMMKIRKDKSSNSLFEKIGDFLADFYGSFNVGHAFMLVAGIGIGVLVLTIFGPGNTQISDTDLIGTIGDAGTYGNFSRGSNLNIDEKDINIDFSTQYTTRMILAQIDITSQEKVQVLIGYDNKNLMISGLKVLKLNESNNLMTGYSQIELTNQGDGRYLLFFEKRNDIPQDLKVKVYQNSELVYESSVRTEN